MDTEFLTKYLPLYQKAAVLTVETGLAGIAIAILLGLICEIIECFKVPCTLTVIELVDRERAA